MPTAALSSSPLAAPGSSSSSSKPPSTAEPQPPAKVSGDERTPAELMEGRDAEQALLSVGVAVMQQPVEYLGGLSDEQLSHSSKLVPGSSVGKHLRHVHDHMRLLLESSPFPSTSSSLLSDANPSLNYDVRARNLPQETSVSLTVSAFAELRGRLEELARLTEEEYERADAGTTLTTMRGAPLLLDKKVRLRATTPAVVDVDTTFGRELWFVCLHAIHHYALLKVILVHELGVSVDDRFGVAPSTLVSRTWSAETRDLARADERTEVQDVAGTADGKCEMGRAKL